MLTESEISRYKEEGYIIFEGLIGEDRVVSQTGYTGVSTFINYLLTPVEFSSSDYDDQLTGIPEG